MPNALRLTFHFSRITLHLLYPLTVNLTIRSPLRLMKV